MQTQQGNDATRLGLERYVLELEMYGLTTVPPEATGVSVATLDCATDRYVLELEMYGLTESPRRTGVSVATLDCATEVLLKRTEVARYPSRRAPLAS